VGGEAGAPAARARASSAHQWTAAWAATPVAQELGLSDRTHRAVLQVTAAGEAVRVRVSNVLGAQPVTIDRAAVARTDGTGPAVLRGTSHPLEFDGRPRVVLAPGEARWSDPAPLAVSSLDVLAVSLYSIDSGPLDAHPALVNEIDTSYLSTDGDHVDDIGGRAFVTATRTWLGVTGVDVLAASPHRVLVAFGDSLSDGAFWQPRPDDADWPTILARRLTAAGTPMAVVNSAAGGNALVAQGRGPRGTVRFERDALDQTGVTDIVVLIGINDLGLGVHPDELIAAYRGLVAAAHRRGVRVLGATLTPYDKASLSAARQAVNERIRSGDVFDAVIDFDAAVRDPANPSRWRQGFSDDGLHPNRAGAAVLAAAAWRAVVRTKASAGEGSPPACQCR
jgi:lysophospholipase L1-like esterase